VLWHDRLTLPARGWRHPVNSAGSARDDRHRTGRLSHTVRVWLFVMAAGSVIGHSLWAMFNLKPGP